MSTISVVSALAFCVQLATECQAQAVPSRQTLWRPVPHDSLRALGSDRPGNGENRFTVDPGHVQVEVNARAKINLWGDYSGSTAVARIPGIYLPPTAMAATPPTPDSWPPLRVISRLGGEWR